MAKNSTLHSTHKSDENDKLRALSPVQLCILPTKTMKTTNCEHCHPFPKSTVFTTLTSAEVFQRRAKVSKHLLLALVVYSSLQSATVCLCKSSLRPQSTPKRPKSQILVGERKKPINVKNFGGTAPAVCPVCPMDMSHLSRHVSRLSRGTFCPLNVNFHINLPKRPGCPWDVPNLSRGRFRGIPTTKFLHVIYLYRFFLLHISGHCLRDWMNVFP